MQARQEGQPRVAEIEFGPAGEARTADRVLRARSGATDERAGGAGRLDAILDRAEQGRPEPVQADGVAEDNRVGDAVLFDYFSYVTDPEIEYKEGVVTLRGSLADQKKLRIVTEMVIAGFSDVWTNDLVNEIKVGN